MLGMILKEALKQVVKRRGAEAMKYIKPGVDAAKGAGKKVADVAVTAKDKTAAVATKAADKAKEVSGTVSDKASGTLDNVAKKIVGESKTVTANVDKAGRVRYSRTDDGKPVTKYTADRYARKMEARKEAVKEDIKKVGKAGVTAATVVPLATEGYKAAKDLKVSGDGEAKAAGTSERERLIAQIPTETPGVTSTKAVKVQGGDENNTGGSADKKEAAKKKKGSGTFSDAFAAARKDGKDVFEYNGKMYSTASKEDVEKSGAKDLKEYLSMKKSQVGPEFDL